MLAHEIAERVCGFDLECLSSGALETARLGIMDTIGVTLAGAGEPVAKASWRAIDRAGPTDGPGSIIGQGRRSDILAASLLNGIASHALDFDDCSNTMGGHPSAPVVSALWPLAESRTASGRELMTAYAAGFEVETKLGRAVNFHHYEKGWHPTATLGTFGSAAACARLLGLPPGQIAVALGLAASMASGLKANFGTMAKPYHVGHSARNGLLAALLAAEGVTAADDIFEHPQGFFSVYDGLEHVTPARFTESWMAPCDLDEPGIAFKRHPCCASTHPAIDAMLQLKQRHGVKAEDVTRVRSWTHPRRLRHTNRPDPRTGLDGKFSVQYVLALALANGRVGIGDFRDENVADPRIRAVMSRIEAAADPDARMDTDEHFYATVQLTTRDGTVHEAHVDRPIGRDRNHPLPPGALEDKFRDCAGQVLAPEIAEQALDGFARLLDVGDINTIANLFIATPPATAIGASNRISRTA